MVHHFFRNNAWHTHALWPSCENLKFLGVYVAHGEEKVSHLVKPKMSDSKYNPPQTFFCPLCGISKVEHPPNGIAYYTDWSIQQQECRHKWYSENPFPKGFCECCRCVAYRKQERYCSTFPNAMPMEYVRCIFFKKALTEVPVVE